MDDKREGPAGKLEDLAGTVTDAADQASETGPGVAGKVAETASGADHTARRYARTDQEEDPEIGRRLRGTAQGAGRGRV